MVQLAYFHHLQFTLESPILTSVVNRPIHKAYILTLLHRSSVTMLDPISLYMVYIPCAMGGLLPVVQWHMLEMYWQSLGWLGEIGL